MIAHALRLFLVRHGDVKADQDVFPLPHLTVNGVILIGGFIEIRDKAGLVPHPEFVLLQVLVHVLHNSGGNGFSKEIQRILPLRGNLVAGAVVNRLLADESRVQQVV